MLITDQNINDIQVQYEALIARRETLAQGKVKVETILTERRRALKKLMDEATAAGHDPNKIQEELQRYTEVVMLKMNVFKSELEAGEDMIRPMLKELREGT